MSTVAIAPAISVIMSALNAERTIEIAIRSILWQTFTDWEFIVIDDGSTDSTRALVGNLRDPRIRLVPHSERRGLARRLNEAVSLVRGAYIARMDADDIAYPSASPSSMRSCNGILMSTLSAPPSWRSATTTGPWVSCALPKIMQESAQTLN